MAKRFFLPALAALAAAPGCTAEQDDQRLTTIDLDEPASEAHRPPPPPPPPPPPGPGEVARPANEGSLAADPKPLAPDAAKTEEGARNVLLSFARKIERGALDRARDMLDPASKARWSQAQWTALFDGLSRISVAVPDGRVEGAAGSSYYAVDLTISARDADGRPVEMKGPIVLRRANDIPGSTAEERNWHIESFELSTAGS